MTAAKRVATARNQPAARIASDDDDFPAFKESMAYQAQLLARLTQNDYMSRVGDTGISPAQAYVLGELWAGPLSQIELARRLEIGKATVGQTLNRMERDGLVERRRGPDDRRVAQIHLTEKARAIKGPLKAATHEQNEALERRLEPELIKALTALLTYATSTLVRSGLAENAAARAIDS